MRYVRRSEHILVVVLLVLLSGAISNLIAQGSPSSPSATPTPSSTPKPSLEKHFFINLLKDQYGIWTFPLRLQKDDWKWAVPLAGASIALLNTDEATGHALDYDKTRLDVSKAISVGGTGYATAGSAIAIYAIGRATHNARCEKLVTTIRGIRDDDRLVSL